MILILSGPSGSGKSTSCAAAYERLSRAGTVVGGVRCAAVFENGIKIGIDAVLPGAGQTGMPLARLRTGFDQASARGRPDPDPSKRRVPLFDIGNPSGFSFGMWDFYGATLGLVDASIAAWLRQVMQEVFPFDQPGRRPVAIIDEIGPLELEHGLGFMRTLSSLDAIAAGPGEQAPACVVTSRPEIAIALKERWPSSTAMEPLPGGGFDVEEILRAVREAG